jgi:hypothetical protein
MEVRSSANSYSPRSSNPDNIVKQRVQVIRHFLCSCNSRWKIAKELFLSLVNDITREENQSSSKEILSDRLFS